MGPKAAEKRFAGQGQCRYGGSERAALRFVEVAVLRRAVQRRRYAPALGEHPSTTSPRTSDGIRRGQQPSSRNAGESQEKMRHSLYFDRRQFPNTCFRIQASLLREQATHDIVRARSAEGRGRFASQGAASNEAFRLSLSCARRSRFASRRSIGFMRSAHGGDSLWRRARLCSAGPSVQPIEARFAFEPHEESKVDHEQWNVDQAT